MFDEFKNILLNKNDQVNLNSSIENIGFVFENVESIIVPVSHIKDLDLGKIEAYNMYPLDSGKEYICDYLKVEISYDDESCLVYNCSDYEEPLGMFILNPTSNLVIDRPNILGRILNYSDLTCIEYIDGNLDVLSTIYIPWGSDSEYENTYMKTEVKEGYLSITVIKD